MHVICIGLALGCLLGVTRAFSTGLDSSFYATSLLDPQVFSTVCSITRIIVLLVLTIVGYIGFYNIGRRGVIASGVLLAVSVILLAVPNTVAIIFSSVLAGVSSGVLMMALMLVMSSLSVQRIVSGSLLGLFFGGMVIMGLMRLDGVVAIGLLLLSAFVTSDIMLIVDPQMKSSNADGEVSMRRWQTFAWLAALLFFVSGSLGSILYGIATTLEWGGTKVVNPAVFATSVIVVVLSTSLIVGKVKNWTPVVWLPMLALLAIGLVFSFLGYAGTTDVAIGLLLASVFCYHFLRWMVFPALVAASEMPRVLTCGIILLLTNNFLNVNLGELMAGLMPAGQATISGVAGVMCLILMLVFVLGFVFGGRDHPGFSTELPETVQPEIAQAADDAEEAAVLSIEERCNELASEHELTPRETEIALLTAKGYSSTYIAEKLVISASTVRFHQQNIYRKINIHNRQEFLDMVN